MPSYIKPSVGPAWGESAANPGDIITMLPADIQTGWTNTGTPPSRQRFNYILNWCANAVRYFMQRGMVDYDAAETYGINAVVLGTDGSPYKSLQNANTGHSPVSSPTWWVRWGFTLAQINASQLTQINIATGDGSTKVANTNFVQAAITSLNATLTAAIGVVHDYVTAGFSVSLGANGYIQLPTWASGFMLQWKHGATRNVSGATNDENFPTPFPNSCLFCFVSTLNGTPTDTSMSYFQVVSWTSSKVTLFLMRNSDHSFDAVSSLIVAIGH